MGDTIDVKRVLKATNLFDALDDTELQAVVDSAHTVVLGPAELIVRQGEIGDELYVVVDGAVQVFTRPRPGTEIVLARLEAGAFFGEQALLEPGNRRNASVRAHESVTLVRVAHDQFARALSKDSPLVERLERLGEEASRDNLVKQSTLFRSLELGSGDWSTEKAFADGDIVFSQGDAGDDFYVIVSGTAGVYNDEGGTPQLVVKLREGQCFGELALIDEAPRAATVIAEGPLKVLCIDGGHFIELYRRTPDLQRYMQTLQKVYLLPGRGFTTQHTGEFLGHDAITTMYHLAGGRKVLASRVIGQELFNMDVLGESGGETWRHQSDEGEREIIVKDGRVIGATVRGAWAELGDVHALVLRDEAIEGYKRPIFERKGTLHLEDEASFQQASDMICSCLQIRRGPLESAMKSGCASAADLESETGAGSVCGACVPRLKEMCGRADWTPVICQEVIDRAHDVRSFRFVPTAGALKPFKPGQHIVIQARIEDAWVQRPYTLSSDANATDHYEITVKREPRGLLSGWMFEQLEPDSLLKISSPQGHFHLDVDEDASIVCYVGGIGMTPALTICRSLVAAGKARRLHIDYSAPRGFVCTEELEAAARDHDPITVTLRATREQGRITPDVVQGNHQSLPDAVYFICGPQAFQDAIVGCLRALGVPDERVNVEVFTPQGEAPALTTANAMPDGNEFLWRDYALDEAPDQGPDPDAVDSIVTVTRRSPVAEQAEAYLRQFYEEKGVPEAFGPRWREVAAAIERTGTYRHTYDELAFGAKLAWRNASRCVGRLFWQGLQLRDARDLTTADEMFASIREHMHLATNGGNLRAVMTVFRPKAPDESVGPRVWNSQLVRYAGYRQRDGSVLGDPANADFTDQALKLGWTPPARRGRFDVLPIIISLPGQRPAIYDLPRELCMEVELEHPDHAWFADFGLRWYVLPAVSEMLFHLGGIEYTAAPFNGWYMGTEIGARNLSDSYRYDMLPAIADKLGLDTRSERTLWKDRALVELNVAVLHSFEKRGAKIIDHHAACHDFLEFARQEHGCGRKVSGRWSWLVPPVSGSATACFHHEFEEHTVLPQYFYQPHAWKELGG